MKKTAFSIIITAFLLLSACTPEPTAVPVTDTPEPTPELIEAAPTPKTESEEAEIDDPVFEIEETKTTLLLYSGDARISRDDGETWALADTGLWLVSGDRLQIGPGGIAVILFPDGSLIRLEGFTDFKLVEADFDFEAGTKRVIGHVIDGAALVTTVPLPNAESIFQLWLMTTLIDLQFDPDQAVPLDQAESIPDEDRISFGVAMREDLGGEYLFSYGGSVIPDFYALELIDGDVVMIKTTPASGEVTDYFLPFRDLIEAEFELERLLDYAAGVLAEFKQGLGSTEINFYGYTFFEEGPLSENQVLYTLLSADEVDEFLAEAAEDPGESQEFIRYVSNSRNYKRHQLLYRYYKTIPDIFAQDILLMLDKYNLGCDIRSGLGCGIPEGCNQESGEGCVTSYGCNIITREGCEKARLSCIAYVNCDWAPCGKRPVVSFFCKPRVRSYCDPDIAGDCDQFMVSSQDQLATLGELIGPDLPDELDPGEDETSEDGSSADSGADDNKQGNNSSLYSFPLEIVQNSELAGQPLYDPNDTAATAQFYSPNYWQQLMDYYRSLYGDYEDDDWDEEDIEWCTCTASTAGFPPPPPWMDLTYRCWCSDPGARK